MCKFKTACKIPFLKGGLLNNLSRCVASLFEPHFKVALNEIPKLYLEK